MVKNLPAMWETRVKKMLWNRAWQPPPAFLPGEPYGQSNQVGYSPWGHKTSDTTGHLSTHSTGHLCDAAGSQDTEDLIVLSASLIPCKYPKVTPGMSL